MNWFKKLFDKHTGPYPVEDYRRGVSGKPRPEDTFLKRQRIQGTDNYRYWCRCGTELKAGDGDAVCGKCNICYGKLPDFKHCKNE